MDSTRIYEVEKTKMMIAVTWYVTPCIMVKTYRRSQEFIAAIFMITQKSEEATIKKQQAEISA
jgi:hypothetical protein